jgi:short-subunit dehydrogenase
LKKSSFIKGTLILTVAEVDALSDGMRLELKKYGIKVLNYCPPETETEFFAKTIHDPQMDPNAHPRKMAKPEDVAGRIVEAIVAEKREVVEGRFLQIMNFFAPKLLDKMFYKGMVLKLGRDD